MSAHVNQLTALTTVVANFIEELNTGDLRLGITVLHRAALKKRLFDIRDRLHAISWKMPVEEQLQKEKGKDKDTTMMNKTDRSAGTTTKSKQPTRPVRIYLAHNFGAQEYLRGLIIPLAAAGFEVTSRWLSVSAMSENEESSKRLSAEMDLTDIRRADLIVYFAGAFDGAPGLGKHIELGYALGLGKGVCLIEETYSLSVRTHEQEMARLANAVFYQLHGIQRFESVKQFIEVGAEKVMANSQLVHCGQVPVMRGTNHDCDYPGDAGDAYDRG